MKNNKNKLNPHFFRKMSNGLDIALMFYKTRLNPQQTQKGNTLLIGLGFGLLVMLLGGLAIAKANNNKINATVNQKAAQALATTEAGAKRSMTKLQKGYPYYLTLNYDPINDKTGKQYLGTDGHQDTPGDNSGTALDEWSTPPPGSTNSPCTPPSNALTTAVLTEDLGLAGNSKLLAYRFVDNTAPTPDNGYLLVEGEKTEGSVTSKARLQLQFTIGTIVPPTSFPGLYANTFVSMGNNTIAPQTPEDTINLVCKDCNSTLPLNCTNGTPSDDYLKDAFDVSNGNTGIDANMIIGEPSLPPLPSPPTNQCSNTQAPPCYILLEPMVTGPNGEDTPVLPRPNDVTQREDYFSTQINDTYNYIFKKDGNDSFNKGDLTVNTTDASIRLYVTGNISLAGSGDEIKHNGSFERFAIFGCTTQVNAISPCISPMTDQEFAISGGASAVNVFIYALNASVGINGGASDPDFQAVIWANTWGKDGSAGVGSSSNQANIVVPDDPSTSLASEFGAVYGQAGIPVNTIQAVNSQQRVKAE